MHFYPLSRYIIHSQSMYLEPMHFELSHLLVAFNHDMVGCTSGAVKSYTLPGNLNSTHNVSGVRVSIFSFL